jgi:glyoxylase-like metal-dependent hydrolase (beta-lactamase superfamily II)
MERGDPVINVAIRVNGRGNAWPVKLGATDLRATTLLSRPTEYTNTSLSLLGLDGLPGQGTILWDVLVDVGQGVVPFLIQNGNQFPRALVLTHPHFDHVSGLDWLIPSYSSNRPDLLPLPVYTTRNCWSVVLQMFPYLASALALRELELGIATPVTEAPGLSLTAFPVYHGPFAPGAILTLVNYRDTRTDRDFRAIITGDLLCPLLRDEDRAMLESAEILFVDSNTRFPWPRSNHWSLTQRRPFQDQTAPALVEWLAQATSDVLLLPHSPPDDAVTTPLLTELQAMSTLSSQFDTTIMAFVRNMKPRRVKLVHYSGYEDWREYGRPILSDDLLAIWVRQEADRQGLPPDIWSIPVPGDLTPLNIWSTGMLAD